jgi:hypothetical protein
MRLVLVLILGVLVGAGGAVLALKWPFGAEGEGDRTQEVEQALLQRVRDEIDRDADSASCAPRQGTDNQYLCDVTYGLTGGQAVNIAGFIVTREPNGLVSYRER